MKYLNKFRLALFAILFLGIASSLFVALPGCNSSTTQEKKDSVIKIGVVFPITGNYSYFGNIDNQGINIAVEYLKAKGIKIEYYLEDNQSNTAKGIAAANKLININKVDVLFSTPSPLCLALNPILENSKIIHIAITNHPNILETKANTLRAFIRAEDDAEEIDNYIANNVLIPNIVINYLFHNHFILLQKRHSPRIIT